MIFYLFLFLEKSGGSTLVLSRNFAPLLPPLLIQNTLYIFTILLQRAFAGFTIHNSSSGISRNHPYKNSSNQLATSILPATMSSSVSSQFTYSSGSYFPTPFHLQQPYIGPAMPVTVPAPVSVPVAPVVPAPVSTVPAAPVVPAPVSVPVVPSAYLSPGVYSIPQYQQAQQLFQKDAQILTPEALESVKAALASSDVEHKAETKKKAVPRKAAGQTWEDPTLAEWPENDFRLFCGDIGNEVNDDVLSKAFSRFPSFNMARVVRDKRTGKTKGYGFVSFANPSDLAAALKEMNGKYVGNRPIKLQKSNWKERIDYGALQKQKSNNQKKPKLPKKSVLHK